jgi:hypothetical protein
MRPAPTAIPAIPPFPKEDVPLLLRGFTPKGDEVLVILTPVGAAVSGAAVTGEEVTGPAVTGEGVTGAEVYGTVMMTGAAIGAEVYGIEMMTGAAIGAEVYGIEMMTGAAIGAEVYGIEMTGADIPPGIVEVAVLHTTSSLTGATGTVPPSHAVSGTSRVPWAL